MNYGKFFNLNFFPLHEIRKIKKFFYIENSLINVIINKINTLSDFELMYSETKIENHALCFTLYNFLHEDINYIINELNIFAKYKNSDVLYVFFDVENCLLYFTA